MVSLKTRQVIGVGSKLRAVPGVRYIASFAGACSQSSCRYAIGRYCRNLIVRATTELRPRVYAAGRTMSIRFSGLVCRAKCHRTSIICEALPADSSGYADLLKPKNTFIAFSPKSIAPPAQPVFGPAWLARSTLSSSNDECPQSITRRSTESLLRHRRRRLRLVPSYREADSLRSRELIMPIYEEGNQTRYLHRLLRLFQRSSAV